jgi:hypothetical protein
MASDFLQSSQKIGLPTKIGPDGAIGVMLMRSSEEGGPYHNFPGSFDTEILQGTRTVTQAGGSGGAAERMKEGQVKQSFSGQSPGLILLKRGYRHYSSTCRNEEPD